MGVREVWLDGGSVPQQPYTMRELFPELRSDEGEDLTEDSDYGPVVVDTVEHPSQVSALLPHLRPHQRPRPRPLPSPRTI